MTPYVKATAVGIITGLLTPVAIAAGAVAFLFGMAATGGGGVAGVSGDLAGTLAVPVLVLLVATGFIAGFAWTLRRARRHDRR
jgi:hypothetical protein